MLRSGTSVGANYREAYRGRSKAEFIAKCGDSLRELEETAYWLELLLEAGIVPPEKLGELRKECDELIAIFVTILKRSKEPFEDFLIHSFLFRPFRSFSPDDVFVVCISAAPAALDRYPRGVTGHVAHPIRSIRRSQYDSSPNGSFSRRHLRCFFYRSARRLYL